MVWFKVDDKLHSHPKTSNASLAAMGLWTVAGSWCGDHTTDGRVPAAMIPSLSRGAVELADELVAAGLWVRVKDGYRFHQWLADRDGTKRNPSKKEVEQARAQKAAAGRKGGLASGITRSKREAGASTVLPVSLNPRPDPILPLLTKGKRVGARANPPPAQHPGEAPPPRCEQHLDNPSPGPCPPCGDARKALNQWVLDKAKWDRDAPKCPKHQGKFAHNCPLCRAEEIGASDD
jgi:hypothetical protein